MALQPINKNTVKALLRKGETFTGYIAPNKVSREHVAGGWYIGMSVTFTSIPQMESTIRDFAYYNCNAELGRRVRFWKEQG